MFEIVVVLLLVGALVLIVGPRLRGRAGNGGGGGLGGRGGPGGQMASGTLLVTGVSSGADSGGSHFVTLTGIINGPTVSEHEIYTRTVMPVGTAPTIGQLIPVAYSPKNPDKWGFAPPDVPQAPDSPTPPPPPN